MQLQSEQHFKIFESERPSFRITIFVVTVGLVNLFIQEDDKIGNTATQDRLIFHYMSYHSSLVPRKKSIRTLSIHTRNCVPKQNINNILL